MEIIHSKGGIILKRSIISLITGFIVLIGGVALWSAGGRGPIQANVERGVYIAKIPLKISDLKKLPVPKTNEDYAFIQSIDVETNVVIGKFKAGQREITLIQDRNSDGKVDLVVRYFVDRDSFKYSARPRNEFTEEKFKKLKEDILNGKQDEVNPNKEAIEYIKVLQQNSDRVRRWKNGFRVFLVDADDETSEQMNFFFSISSSGADLVFELNYRNQGVTRMSPIINQSVYCKDSKDPLILEVTKQLIKEAANFVPVSD